MKVRRDRLLWFKWAINCSCKHFILLLSKVLHVLFELGLGQSFCNCAMFYFWLCLHIFRLDSNPSFAIDGILYFWMAVFTLWCVFKTMFEYSDLWTAIWNLKIFLQFCLTKKLWTMKVNFEKKYAWDLKSRRLRDKIPWGVTWNIRSKMVYQSLTKNN